MAEPSVSLDVSAPRPGLRGHHQRHRGPSSTPQARNASPRSRRRSRYARITARVPPSIGAAVAIAAVIAGPPGDASRQNRPVPAASATDIDPKGLRGPSGPARSLARFVGSLPVRENTRTSRTNVTMTMARSPRQRKRCSHGSYRHRRCRPARHRRRRSRAWRPRAPARRCSA